MHRSIDSFSCLCCFKDLSWHVYTEHARCARKLFLPFVQKLIDSSNFLLHGEYLLEQDTSKRRFYLVTYAYQETMSIPCSGNFSFNKETLRLQ